MSWPGARSASQKRSALTVSSAPVSRSTFAAARNTRSNIEVSSCGRVCVGVFGRHEPPLKDDEKVFDEFSRIFNATHTRVRHIPA
jgi:hypothetical protein